MGAFKNRAFYEYRTEENKAVKAELAVAGVPIIELPAYMRTEVKTNIIGILNGFLFTRMWHYWVCSGDMPIDHARKIYDQLNHLGVQAVGDTQKNGEPIGYCPRMLQLLTEKAEQLQAMGVSTNDVIAELKQLQATEDPSWPRFIKEFHIYTSEGLAAIAKYIQENNVYAHNGQEGSYAAFAFERREIDARHDRSSV